MSGHHTIDPRTVEAFLAGHRLAVVGASDDPKSFGRTIHHELTEHGYDTVAVHPTATTVNGRPCYPDVRAVPGTLDGAVVMVPSERSAEVVDQCAEAGVPMIWLFRGIGGDGAVSDDAVARCREHGLPVVDGACPLMFLEPVGFVHRVHRFVRRHNGSITSVAAA